jgi:4-diphosphocytidyl-2C-methyl-D-erythritol kinase
VMQSARTEIAYAKINLALHVRARRGDGYHELETLFAFCDFGDALTISAADRFAFSVDGEFGAGLGTDADNLVVRAAMKCIRRFISTCKKTCLWLQGWAGVLPMRRPYFA